MEVHKDFIMPEENSIKKKVKVVEDTQRQESIYYKFMDSLPSMMAPIK
jgi:hypothetical protein